MKDRQTVTRLGARERRHARQLGIVHPDILTVPVTIVGVGAIGSTTARVLTQLGFRHFRFFDGDLVSPENLGVQFYRLRDVGRPKVEALRDVLRMFLPNLSIEAHEVPFAAQALDGIVVAGVDSMHARFTLWRRIRGSASVRLFIDGRTAGEEVHVHTIRPGVREDVRWYNGSLVPDRDAEALPCTVQGAPHAQAVIAGIIGSQIVRWVRGEPTARFVYLNLRTLVMEAMGVVLPQ